MFATPVSIAANPKINEWLTLTEKEMRVTLAKLLQEAVKDIAVFKSGQIDANLYLQWIDKFQVNGTIWTNMYSVCSNRKCFVRSLKESKLIVDAFLNSSS